MVSFVKNVNLKVSGNVGLNSLKKSLEGVKFYLLNPPRTLLIHNMLLLFSYFNSIVAVSTNDLLIFHIFSCLACCDSIFTKLSMR